MYRYCWRNVIIHFKINEKKYIFNKKLQKICKNHKKNKIFAYFFNYLIISINFIKALLVISLLVKHTISRALMEKLG